MYDPKYIPVICIVHVFALSGAVLLGMILSSWKAKHVPSILIRVALLCACITLSFLAYSMTKRTFYGRAMYYHELPWRGKIIEIDNSSSYKFGILWPEHAGEGNIHIFGFDATFSDIDVNKFPKAVKIVDGPAGRAELVPVDAEVLDDWIPRRRHKRF